MNIVDPHLHLIDLELGQYDWLKQHNAPHWPDKAVLRRNVSERDLTLQPPQSLGGFVHIEAGFDNRRPWREIDWLTDTVSLPFSAVACISLQSSEFAHQLSELTQRSKVVGVRDILDDAAVTVLSDSRCQHNLGALAENGLSFDAQLSLSDDASAQCIADTLARHPSLNVIINHGGWPPNANADYQRWYSNMAMLAKFDNVAVKLSGWEIANRHWAFTDALKHLTDTLSLFGDSRVMLASNFPLSNWRVTYQDYWRQWQQILADKLSPAQCAQLLAVNARHWYKL